MSKSSSAESSSNYQGAVDSATYNKLVQKATYAAIITASFLIALKTIVVILSNSISLYATLMDSVFDLACSLINLIILKQASRPADKNHSFGHGKFEYMGVLGQGIFIGTSAIFLLLNAIQRIRYPEVVEVSYLSLIILIVSILATIVLVVYQHKVVKQTNSEIIKSDNQHYSIDLLLNSAVVVAIIASLNGYPIVDSVLACLIAVYMLFSVYGMFKAAYDGLTDVVLPKEDIRIIYSIIRKHPSVIDIHDLRTRKSANTKHIQFHLELADNLTLLETHDICDEIETAILAIFSDAMITIHPEPHSVAERERKGTYQPVVNDELINNVKSEI